MPFVCDPPNTVPPAVVQLADKYEYSCAKKITPRFGLKEYDVYRVLKYNSYESFILIKNSNARFITKDEAKKIDFSCGWDDGTGCLPFEIVDNAYHPIILE